MRHAVLIPTTVSRSVVLYWYLFFGQVDDVILSLCRNVPLDVAQAKCSKVHTPVRWSCCCPGQIFFLSADGLARLLTLI